jgi:hypothetical protein
MISLDTAKDFDETFWPTMNGMSMTEAESALHCYERLEIPEGQMAKHLWGSSILW